MRTHNIPFSIKVMTITLNYPKSAATCVGFCQGLQERVKKSLVNEPSVFEPLSATVLG